MTTSLLLALLAGGCGREQQQGRDGKVVTSKPVDDRKATTEIAPVEAVSDTNAAQLAAAKLWPVGFTGSQACARCHQERFDGFQETDHSRSFRRPDLAEEISLPSFMHEASRQMYKVSIGDDAIFHTGWQMFDGSESRLPVADAKIEYVIGSGAFAKSYLFADRDSLVQVPLSFYVSTGQYDMSPGYNSPAHFGFTREVSDQCLFCHVGILQRKDDNPNHIQIQELAIGCERCHGPGREHANHMDVPEIDGKAKSVKPSGDTAAFVDIVHPGKLDRLGLEAVCAQCHLQGNVTMHPAGKDAWSFRPGQRLSSTRIAYSVEPEDTAIGFVGHFDQLHSSACYQQSETLNCTTCHDPHHEMPAANRIEIRRRECLSCHDGESCGVPLPRRLSQNKNDCVTCHMPRGKTEVPHVSITNHRIAVYRHSPPVAKIAERAVTAGPVLATNDSGDSATVLPTPVALLDGSPLGSWQRERNEATALAIWYLDEAGGRGTEAQGREVLRRLVASLDAVARATESSHSEAVDVPVVSEATTRACMARLLTPTAAWRRTPIADPDEVERLFKQASAQARFLLRLEPSPTPNHEIALLILSADAAAHGRFAEATDYYERLIRLRRDHTVLYNLSLAYGQLGRLADAANALGESIRVQPSFAPAYRSLSRLYDHMAPERASQLRQIAELLENEGDRSE